MYTYRCVVIKSEYLIVYIAICVEIQIPVTNKLDQNKHFQHVAHPSMFSSYCKDLFLSDSQSFIQITR